MVAKSGSLTSIATCRLKPLDRVCRYPLCAISHRASSRPARASHAAAAAAAMGALTQLLASTTLHIALVVTAALIGSRWTADLDVRQFATTNEEEVSHVVFLAPELAPTGGGGGGGGNQQPGPIRRAQGVGADAITLRVRKQPPSTVPLTTAAASAVEDVPPLPSIVLDAQPLASGLFEQIGLPTGGVVTGTSTGPGSGGGVGTGSGTGTGSGRGPGYGPGSGGGAGGGIYRPGGSVSAPRLIKETKPKYTSDALRNGIQGTVVLETIVTADGCASEIRIVRSLDAGGLDQEALAAVAQWRFEPGRLEPRRSTCSSRSRSIS